MYLILQHSNKHFTMMTLKISGYLDTKSLDQNRNFEIQKISSSVASARNVFFHKTLDMPCCEVSYIILHPG